jgi:hypothetical protein
MAAGAGPYRPEDLMSKVTTETGYSHDVVAGRPVEIGPEIDEPRAWAEYRRRTPARDREAAPQ